ncbi:phosphatidic acid phosphatase protein-like protein [Novymonas esmeraldas]|uniref:Phosphatidic acid phosphatase protein-like protein n=1 Tax=Novymonas esmeraldas TaxID=1808958 RepID=A0AAW0EUY5_9TRYP
MVELSSREFHRVWNQYQLLDWCVLACMFLIASIVTAYVQPHCRTFSWNDATIAYPSHEDTFPNYALVLMLLAALSLYVVFVWYLVRPLQSLIGEPLDWYAIGGSGGGDDAVANLDATASPRRLRVRDMQSGRGLLYPWIRAQLWSAGLQFCVLAVLKVYAGRLRPDYLSRLKTAGYTSADKKLPDPQTDLTFFCGLMAEHPALKEGRLSFPSGHSSTSFAVFTIVSLFFVAHLRPFARHASFARLMVCLLPLAVSTMCAVSRTRDNKHHFSDIIAGSLIGIASALLAFHGSFRQVGGATGIYFCRTATDIEYEQLRDGIGGGEGGSGAAVEAMATVGGGGSGVNYNSASKREDVARRRPGSPALRGDDTVVVVGDSTRRPPGLTERRLNEDPAAVPWI